MPTKRLCESCGAVNDENDLFCPECGLTAPSSITDSTFSSESDTLIRSAADLIVQSLSVENSTLGILAKGLFSKHQHQAEEPVSELGKRLLLAGDTAFSRLPIDVKVRFFDWLLPVARFDRVIDERVLACIYMVYAIANLPDQERQRLTWLLFRPEPLPEPGGKFEVGGRFQKLWLLLYAIDIAWPEPSDRAGSFIAKLAHEEGFSATGVAAILKTLKKYAPPVVEGVDEQLSNHPTISSMFSAVNPYVGLGLLGVHVAAKLTKDEEIQNSSPSKEVSDKIPLSDLKLSVLLGLLQNENTKAVSPRALADYSQINSIRERQLDFLKRDLAVLRDQAGEPDSIGSEVRKSALAAFQALFQSKVSRNAPSSRQ
jgi:hypothetical protein